MIRDIKTDYSTFILLENGDLWGCGKNEYGELGLGHAKQIDTFTKICDNVEKIDYFWNTIFLFKKDKTLWFAGNGKVLNKSSNVFSFTKIADNVENILPLRSLKLFDKNFLFCFKKNGDFMDLISNKTILTDVKKVTYGCLKNESDSNICVFIIKKDNSLWSFSDKGELIDLKHLKNVKNVFSDYKSPIFIQRTDNSLWEIKYDSSEKLFGNISNDSKKLFNDIKDVKIVNFNIFFLKRNGDLFVLGDNSFGNLGIKQEKIDTPVIVNKNVRKIYLEDWFSIILKDDNSLWGCGKNEYKILGNEPENFVFYSFKKISDDVKKVYKDDKSLFIIKLNGELLCSGKIAKNFQGTDYLKPISKDVKNIFFNCEHFFIQRNDNSLLCFGNNEYSQLGIKTSKKKVETPIENNVIKNYYNTKETIEVVKNVFKEKSL